MTGSNRRSASSAENEKRTWYSTIAEIYLEARPKYPQALIDYAITFAHLDSNSNILEVGCGPGNATISFAHLGTSIQCIEHNREFCMLAQQNTRQFPQVEIYNSSFEAWELEPGRYNAVLSANAFYQIPSEVSYQKAAAALKERGHLILLWNLTPELQYEVYRTVEPIYQTYIPSLVRHEGAEIQQNILQGFRQDLERSGYFEPAVTRQVACQITYTVEQYLSLLSTLRRIDSQTKNLCFTDLSERLHEQGNNVELAFLSAVQIAQKK